MRNENISSKKKLAAGLNVKERDYWLNRLSGEIEKSFFPYDFNDYKKDSVVERRLSTLEFSLSVETGAKLLRMCNNSDHRLHMILVSGWALLLAKYTGNKEILTGTPIYKQDIDGEFINTVLTLRINLEPAMTFKEILLHVRQVILEAVENQNYPIEALLYKLNLSYTDKSDAGALDRFPLFDTAVLLKGLHDKNYLRHIRHNMTVSFMREGDHIEFEIEYDASLYEGATIARIAGHLEAMFRGVLTDPDMKLAGIEILPEEERQRLLIDFNDTRVDYPKDKTVHQLFEEQAVRTPNLTAVSGLTGQLTYRELNEQSNRLAALLRDKGITRDIVVGIILEPSLDMIVGIIGILKAGGAYLPLDTAYPLQRIMSILEENEITLLITRETDYDTAILAGAGRAIVCLDRIGEVLNRYPVENPGHINQPCDILYLITTSGSTGAPKSLMIEHRNFVNLLNFGFYETGILFRKVLQFASIGFDLSVQEIFSPLLTGGEVYLISRDYKSDISRLFEYIQANGVNVVFWTPAFLKYVFSEPQYRAEFPRSIEHICVAGEQLVITEPLRKYIRESGLRVHNFYGPAETHVVTTYTIEPTGRIAEMPCIGKPVSNTQIYILDEEKKVKPLGTIGELYIGGANVGRGYLNRPELTSEKFGPQMSLITQLNRIQKTGINKSFGKSILYRTGDLARWLPDGNIEFIGRVDFQVKIRGFRVELGEVESQIVKTGLVKEAVVLDVNDLNDEKYLCAYIVSAEPGFNINGPEIRETLANTLPGYMIPSYFVQVESIPFTVHGKVDRKALPSPDIKARKEYTAPRNGIEARLVEIWHEVLGIEPRQGAVGIDDNFFDLGGHSLKATVLITKVHKAFNTRLTLGEMFKQPTIRGMAGFIEKAKNEVFESIAPVEVKAYYPLSSAQKRIYILQRMNLGNMSYNNPASVVLEGSLDVERLEAVLRNLIIRHEMLRTSFIEIEGQPMQQIREQLDFSVEYRDMRGMGEADIEAAVKAFTRPFDLGAPPLLRVGLLRTGEDAYIFSYDMHHIITDGTSMQVFIKEFMALYSGKELLPLRIQYKDFSEWQNRMFRCGGIADQEKFWLQCLEGELLVSNVPVDYPRPAVKSFAGSFEKFHIGKEETAALRKLAREENATIYMVLLSVFNILLARLSGHEEILVGAPVAGRRHLDLQYIIGMFINMLVMRNYPRGGKTSREFLAEVRAMALAVFENQEYPFEELVDRLVVKRDTGRNPIVDVVFVLQNMDIGDGDIPEVEIPGLRMYPFQPGQKGETAKFDLLLVGVESPEGLGLAFEYCTRLFKKETIERFAAYFKTIVSLIIKDPGMKLCEIEIIPEEEKERILYDFNNTAVEYPREKTIHQLFAEQVERNPDYIAIVGADLRVCPARNVCPDYLTYRQLNEQSDRLAGLLIEKGVLADDIVAIKMARSIEMVIGILGSLKAGCAYMPIDPDYPQERIDYMLKDSNAKILINKSEIRNPKFETNPNDQKINAPNKNKNCCPGPTLVLDFDYLNFEFVSNFDIRASDLNSLNLAYIMYTSGSTGKPKGVMVGHRSVIRLVVNNDYIEFSDRLRVLQTGAPVFDAVTFEMWGPMLNGGRLYLVDNNVILDAGQLGQVLKKYLINTLWLTSSLFNQLAQQDDDMFSTLQWLVVGGDVLSPRHIAGVKLKNKGLTIVNGYGPTENTTFSVCHRIERDYEHNIPIGKPIGNSCAYIIDKYHRLQPVGIAGELYVGGDGLARGYLNNPELTREKFIYFHHSSFIIHHSNLYKTGDLVRWLPGGIIEFLGRIDHQVKIRGFRVELGEIENLLLAHKEIKEAAVTMMKDAKKGEDKFLCAYITANRELEIAELRQYLGHKLPVYMIPAYFIQLEKLPLTVNGKVNPSALPTPLLKTGEKHTVPVGEIEEKLTAIWADLLDLEKETIGVAANFFELGGHSLKAAMLASLINKEFNVEFPLREVFTAPTVREESEIIKNLKRSDHNEIKPAEPRPHYPQSPAQKRIFFLEQLDNIGFSCHIISSMKVGGNIDIQRFDETLKRLVDRHEPLRTSFEVIENDAAQRVHDTVDVDFKVEYYDLTETRISDDFHEITANFIKPFDLARAPLFRVGLYKLAAGRYLLLYDIHHIIGDGTSLEILVEEFMQSYAGEDLVPLAIQYKDFAVWQKDMSLSAKMTRQENYWLNLFSGAIPRLNFPTDFPRPNRMNFTGDSYMFHVEGEIPARFKQIGMSVGATLYMSLLTAYNILLYKYTGQNDIVVGTGIMGRPHASLYKMIGMFINMLALRNYPAGEKSYLDLLKEVSENTIKAFENQDVQFDEIVDKLKISRDYSRNPLFDVELSLNNFQQARIAEKHRGDLNFELCSYDNKTTKFDLVLYANDVGDSIYFNFRYSTSLFKRETIAKIARHFSEILQQVVENQNIRLDEIKLSSDMAMLKSHDLEEDPGDFDF